MEHLSKKASWDNTYINIALEIAKHSKALRKKTGAILVKDNRIISIGYNGTPHGFDNTCEIEGVTKREVLHAESNAISKCAKSHESTNQSVLYTTLSPCFDCSKLIIQCGIIEVIYLELYRDTTGLDLLTKAGIKSYGIQ